MCMFFSLFKSTVLNFMPYYFILDVRLYLFSSIPSLVQNVFVFSLSCSLFFNFVCVFFFVLCNWCDLQSKRIQFTTAFKWYSQIAWIKKSISMYFRWDKGFFIAHMKIRMIFCTTTVNVIGLITGIDACYFNLTLLVIKCVNFFVRMFLF